MHKNEALNVIFSKKIISRSKKVTLGQKSWKKVKKCQIWIFIKIRKIIHQIEALNVSSKKKEFQGHFSSRKLKNGKKKVKKCQNYANIRRFFNGDPHFQVRPILVNQSPRAKREAKVIF